MNGSLTSSHTPRRRYAKPRPRRGIVLVAMLVLLAVVGSIAASRIRQSLLDLRNQRQLLDHMQTRLLADAALQRALVKWRQDPPYRGDVWEVQAGLPAGKTAEVTTSVRDGEDATTFQVVVEYAAAAPDSSQQLTRSMKLSRNQQKPGSSD